MSPLKPLDFIRHGSTKLNNHNSAEDDKIRGWIDVPLDDRGRQEAHKIGKKLKGPEGLISSDLNRAVETAHIISKESGIPYVGKALSLRPWNLGHFQGQESAKVAPMIAQMVNHPDQAVPGGESFQEFLHRFLSGLGKILQLPHRIGIVAHHRNERVLAALQKGGWKTLDTKEFERRGNPPGFMVTFDIPADLFSGGRS